MRDEQHLTMARLIVSCLALARVEYFPESSQWWYYKGFSQWFQLDEVKAKIPPIYLDHYRQGFDGLRVTLANFDRTVEMAGTAGLLDPQLKRGVWRRAIDISPAFAVELILRLNKAEFSLSIEEATNLGRLLCDSIEQARREQQEFEQEQRERNRV